MWSKLTQRGPFSQLRLSGWSAPTCTSHHLAQLFHILYPLMTSYLGSFLLSSAQIHTYRNTYQHLYVAGNKEHLDTGASSPMASPQYNVCSLSLTSGLCSKSLSWQSGIQNASLTGTMLSMETSSHDVFLPHHVNKASSIV